LKKTLSNKIEKRLINPREKKFEGKYLVKERENLKCPLLGRLTGQRVQNFFRGSKTPMEAVEVILFTVLGFFF